MLSKTHSMVQTSNTPTSELTHHPSIKAWLPAWGAAELQPQQLVKSLTAAVLLFLLEIIVVTSLAALIFADDRSSSVVSGIGFFLIGDAVLLIGVACLSAYAGSTAATQDAPVVILAVAVAAAARATPEGAAHTFATVILMVVVTTLATGLCFVLLGAFKLGALARFVPYPVLGGFLAGSGWLLLVGALDVMAGAAPSLAFLRPDMLLHWAPGLLLGLAMLVVLARVGNPLVLPGLALVSIALFYLVAWLAHVPLDQLRAQGWLLSSAAPGGMWQFPLSVEHLRQANWAAIGDQAGTLSLVLVVSVLGFLMNASGLELVVKQDLDLNHELIAAGVTNLACGLGGGAPGFHMLSLSALNHTLSGGRRLTGICMGLLCGATALLGIALFAFIPKLILGGLLSFLGLSMLVDWVYRSWFKFSKIEFAMIMIILLVMIGVGILEGIAVGLVAAVVLFVISYSRVSVVKHTLSGATYHSRVQRSPQQRALLDMHGEQISVLQLQGFIFFGTAHSIVERIRRRARQPGIPALRLVVLDFAQVTGLDSTAALSFKKLVQLTEAQQIALVLTSLSDRLASQFTTGEFSAHADALRLFPDLDRGLEWCEDQIIATTPADRDAERGLQDYLAAIVPQAENLPALMRYLNCREIPAGEYLIHQGDAPDVLFFIASGQVTVQRESLGRPPVRLETMRGGRSVGELGFYLGTSGSTYKKRNSVR